MKQFFLLITIVGIVATASASPNAADDYQSYSTLNYGDNGGYGLGPITYLEGTGGGVFLAGPGSGIDPAGSEKSMGIYAGGGTTDGQAAYRSLVSVETVGTYSVSARFNLGNDNNFSGFNIKSAAGATFGANELLSFGLTPGTGNQSIALFDATGTHTIALGNELRGAIIDFSLAFDTNAGTYTLNASDRGVVTGSFSGLLKDTNGAAFGVGGIADLGFANFNNGGNQDLIVDNIVVVPEPATWFAMALASAGALLIRRRRQTAA